MDTYLTIVALALSITVAAAAVHPAASTSQSDVQAALAACAPGDTCVLPVGTNTWTSTVTSGASSLTVIGSGTNSTRIIVNVPNSGGEFVNAGLYLNGGGYIQVSGITFEGMGTGMYAAPALAIAAGGAVARVHDCHFYRCRRGIISVGNFGVADHCTFRNNLGGVQVFGIGSDGMASWLQYAPIAFNSTNYFFVEDCKFEYDDGPTYPYTEWFDPNAMSSDQGASIVFRYNTIRLTGSSHSIQMQPMVDFHGDQPNGTRGVISAQIYSNRVDAFGTAFAGRITADRGGMSLSYSNVVNGVIDRGLSLSEEHPEGTQVPPGSGPFYYDNITNTWQWANVFNGTNTLFWCDACYPTGAYKTDYHDAAYTTNVYAQPYPHPLATTQPTTPAISIVTIGNFSTVKRVAPLAVGDAIPPYQHNQYDTNPPGAAFTDEARYVVSGTNALTVQGTTTLQGPVIIGTNANTRVYDDATSSIWSVPSKIWRWLNGDTGTSTMTLNSTNGQLSVPTVVAANVTAANNVSAANSMTLNGATITAWPSGGGSNAFSGTLTGDLRVVNGRIIMDTFKGVYAQDASSNLTQLANSSLASDPVLGAANVLNYIGSAITTGGKLAVYDYSSDASGLTVIGKSTGYSGITFTHPSFANAVQIFYDAALGRARFLVKGHELFQGDNTGQLIINSSIIVPGGSLGAMNGTGLVVSGDGTIGGTLNVNTLNITGPITNDTVTIDGSVNNKQPFLKLKMGSTATNYAAGVVVQTSSGINRSGFYYDSAGLRTYLFCNATNKGLYIDSSGNVNAIQSISSPLVGGATLTYGATFGHQLGDNANGPVSMTYNDLWQWQNTVGGGTNVMTLDTNGVLTLLPAAARLATPSITLGGVTRTTWPTSGSGGDVYGIGAHTNGNLAVWTSSTNALGDSGIIATGSGLTMAGTASAGAVSAGTVSATTVSSSSVVASSGVTTTNITAPTGTDLVVTSGNGGPLHWTFGISSPTFGGLLKVDDKMTLQGSSVHLNSTASGTGQTYIDRGVLILNQNNNGLWAMKNTATLIPILHLNSTNMICLGSDNVGSTADVYIPGTLWLGTGLNTPSITLNGDTRTAWPSGGGGSTPSTNLDNLTVTNATVLGGQVTASNDVSVARALQLGSTNIANGLVVGNGRAIGFRDSTDANTTSRIYDLGTGLVLSNTAAAYNFSGTTLTLPGSAILNSAGSPAFQSVTFNQQAGTRIGTSSYLKFMGLGQNGCYLYGTETNGSTAVDLIQMDATNNVRVGQASRNVAIPGPLILGNSISLGGVPITSWPTGTTNLDNLTVTNQVNLRGNVGIGGSGGLTVTNGPVTVSNGSVTANFGLTVNNAAATFNNAQSVFNAGAKIAGGTLTLSGLTQSKILMTVGALGQVSQIPSGGNPYEVLMGDGTAIGTNGLLGQIGGMPTNSGIQFMELPVFPNATPGSGTAAVVLQNSSDTKLQFGTNSVAQWQKLMPSTYDRNKNLTLKSMWNMETAVSASLTVSAQVWQMTSGQSASMGTESFDTANTVVVTSPGFARYPFAVNIVLTNFDTLSAGDWFQVKITATPAAGAGYANYAGGNLEWTGK